MILRKQPEERAAAGSSREISGLGAQPGRNVRSAAGVLCGFGQPVRLSGLLLPLYNKGVGFHSVKGRVCLLCLTPMSSTWNSPWPMVGFRSVLLDRMKWVLEQWQHLEMVLSRKEGQVLVVL